jgi:hypothetical protein
MTDSSCLDEDTERGIGPVRSKLRQVVAFDFEQFRLPRVPRYWMTR